MNCLANGPEAMATRLAAELQGGGPKTTVWDGPEDSMPTVADGQRVGRTAQKGMPKLMISVTAHERGSSVLSCA